jgi:hypothetical protein
MNQAEERFNTRRVSAYPSATLVGVKVAAVDDHTAAAQHGSLCSHKTLAPRTEHLNQPKSVNQKKRASYRCRVMGTYVLRNAVEIRLKECG